MSNLRTNAQSQRLFGLLKKLNLDDDDRADLVLQFTHNRTRSSKNLTEQEAEQLIGFLQSKTEIQNESAAKMRNGILHYFHLFKWYNINGKLDLDRINAWLLKSGKHHKKLNELNQKELRETLTQVKLWYKKTL